jgi:hypothetical protein
VDQDITDAVEQQAIRSDRNTRQQGATVEKEFELLLLLYATERSFRKSGNLCSQIAFAIIAISKKPDTGAPQKCVSSTSLISELIDKASYDLLLSG